MSTVRPWYKRYPAQFISGTYRMSAEEKGVYAVLIDLMYDRGGALEDDPRELARICGCSTRRFNAIKASLAERHHKIILDDGWITNPRALEQIEDEKKEHDRRAESGQKGGRKSAENRETPKEKPRENGKGSHENKDLDENGLGPLLDHKEEEEESTPQTPLPGGVVMSQWDEFKLRWGTSDAQSPDAEKIFHNLSQPDRTAAIAGIAGYLLETKELARKRCTAKRYLSERRWEVAKPPKPPPSSGPSLPGTVVFAGTPQWGAWKDWFAAQSDPKHRSDMAIMKAREEHQGDQAFYRVPADWPPEGEQ
jgi:uncharacterized protein YdaU (DUF1376 family)